MKQLIFLVALLVTGGLGGLLHPFWPITLYYLLALLRPQYLWDWALPEDWRWSLAAALMSLMSLALHLPNMIGRARLLPASWLVMAFAGCLGLSCIAAYDPAVAQHWGQEYAKILLMTLAAMLVIDQLWQVRTLASVTLLTLGFIAWEINYTYVVDGRLDVFHNGFGGLDNNGAGLLIAIGLPFAYAFGMSAAGYWARLACAFVSLLIMHAVMMTYSRGAMVAGLVGVAWLLLRHRSRAQTVAVAMLLTLAVSFLAGNEIRQRFMTTTQYQQDDSVQLRFDSWAAAWSLVWDQPLTGQGIRNSNLYSENYGADRENRTIHSQYLQIAADSGIPAAMVYLAILSLSLWRCEQARWIASEAVALGRLASDQTHALHQAAHLALAVQTGLIVFMLGAVFLSLEFFEVSWLLAVLANVMPAAVEQCRDAAPRRLERRVRPKPPIAAPTPTPTEGLATP